MGDERLQHLMVINEEKGLVKSLDYEQLVNDFAMFSPRLLPLI